MTTIWIESVSLFAPGLNGWAAACNVLKNRAQFDPLLIPPIESRFLTPTNKRRTSPHMHVALQAADFALRGVDVDETTIELIVTSSEPDLDIAEDDMQALIHQAKEISPQKFQNVILNAAAGHLGIFMKNTSGSTTVSGEKNCFAVGLLQAYTTVLATEKSALMVAHEAPSAMPYGYKDRPFFSVGMLIDKTPSERAIAGLTIEMVAKKNITTMDHPILEEMRTYTPSASCLPLLQAVAEKETGPVALYYSDELALSVTLCF